MSAGHVHTKASLFLAAGFLFTGGWSEAIGSLIGILITPDCDVDNGMISDRYIRQRVGWAMEKIWDGVWYFYRRSIKHGSELSHFPVLGTMGRILYLFFFLVVLPTGVLCFFLPLDFIHEIQWWWRHMVGEWRVILGLMGADLIHYFLDILTTEHANKKTVSRRSLLRTLFGFTFLF